MVSPGEVWAQWLGLDNRPKSIIFVEMPGSRSAFGWNQAMYRSKLYRLIQIVIDLTEQFTASQEALGFPPLGSLHLQPMYRHVPP